VTSLPALLAIIVFLLLGKRLSILREAIACWHGFCVLN